MEYSWGQKYDDLKAQSTDREEKLTKKVQKLELKARKKLDETVKNLVRDFKDDMQTVEDTHKRKQAEASAAQAKAESKISKQAKAIEELK